MALNFKEALQNRRTYYTISNKSLISDNEIEDIINFAVTHVPSSFNSQSTRIVLLLGENHKKLWDITKDVLKKIVPANAFPATEGKINGAFAAGYGTVLYFEDQDVIKGLQEAFPLYAENFPIWSNQTSAMHQLAIWTMLEEAGFGASLQHYNPLIDGDVAKEWDLPSTWKLVAEMPFGIPTQGPGEKEFKPLDERIKVFK
jgi:Predicted oxidoreductase related to nitroreductase